MIALYESLGRLPTPEEKYRLLESMADQAGGSRIYVSHKKMVGPECKQEICRLRDDGYSIRRIASATGCKKWFVEEVLSVRNSAL